MSAPDPLPPEVHAVVDAVVAHARLTRAERELVRRELEDHFLDALEAGCDAAGAVAQFGDATVAADLIGRARRRNRPPVVRFVRGAVLPSLCAAALLLVPYGYSAWRLGAAPARRDVPSFDTALDMVAARASAILASLDSAAPADEGERIERALEEVMELRAQAALVPELESAHLHVKLVETYVRVAPGLAPERRALLRARLDRDFAPRRAVVEAALRDVLDRVYPSDPDGHPTRDGLRAVRRLKGGEATWRTDLLEPAYFLLAAPRAVAEALARDLLSATWRESGAPDAAGLEGALARHPASENEFAVTLVMTRVAAALDATRQARRTLGGLER